MSAVNPLISIKALYRAALAGVIETVKEHIKILRKILPNHIVERKLNKAFCYACKGGHNDVIKLIVDEGSPKFNRGLSWACYGGDLEIVKLLVNNQATTLSEGLLWACRKGHRDIIDYLCQLDITNWKLALTGAYQNGDQSIIDLIMSKDDFNKINITMTQFTGACYRGKLSEVESIISDFEIPERFEIGKIITDFSPEVIPTLVSSGYVDVNDGFRCACSLGNEEIARLMLDFGATNIEEGIKSGQRALHRISYKNDNLTVVKFPNFFD